MTKPRLRSLSLTTRFIALMVTIAAAGILLVAVFSLFEHAADAREDAESVAIDRALTVIDAMETAATDESLARFIFSTAAQPSIRAIALLNAEGTVKLASRRAWESEDDSHLANSVLSGWLDALPEDGARAYWDEQHTQVVAVMPLDPINPASPTVKDLEGGRLLLALDARPYLADARAEAWFDAGWAGGILLLVIAILARVLHQRVALPLQHLYLKASDPSEPRLGRKRMMRGAIQELETLGSAIADLANTRLALDREKERLANIADTIPGAVYEYRYHDDAEDEFTFVSAGVTALLGLDSVDVTTLPSEELTALFWSKVLPDDRQTLEKTTHAANYPLAREWETEFRIQTDDGIRWLWGHAVPVGDPAPGQLFRGVLLDITDRKELEERLKQAATHDPLTGALNRAGLEPQLEASLAGAQRREQPLAVAMLDIDHFKHINDAHGHSMGDTVLTQFVALIHDRLRKSDSLARWGGEEFLILLPHTNADGALELAESLRDAVAKHVFAHQEPLTVSIGVATARPRDTVVELTRRADERLYRAKALGRNRVVMGSDANGRIA